jgi:transposase
MQTFAMDHHGLVAAVCQELGIAEKVDAKLGPPNERRVVSAGTAVVAMILNGLGFTNRRLYLAHQFFEHKPIEKRLGVQLKASDITDHTLGQTLDEIAGYRTAAFESDYGGLKQRWLLVTPSRRISGKRKRSRRS